MPNQRLGSEELLLITTLCRTLGLLPTRPPISSDVKDDDVMMMHTVISFYLVGVMHRVVRGMTLCLQDTSVPEGGEESGRGPVPHAPTFASKVTV